MNDESWSPFILGYASDAMFNQRTWATNLTGIDFEIYHPKVFVQHNTCEMIFH